MKIIKKGKSSIRFKCPICNCVFEKEFHEYEAKSRFKRKYRYEGWYDYKTIVITTTCPNCKYNQVEKEIY